jgi:hypothetical protein
LSVVGATQLNPHVPAVQIAAPLPEAGPGQVVQLAPQFVASLFALHSVPHLWKPFLQVKPQVLPEHVGLPFAGGVHLVVQPPQ